MNVLRLPGPWAPCRRLMPLPWEQLLQCLFDGAKLWQRKQGRVWPRAWVGEDSWRNWCRDKSHQQLQGGSLEAPSWVGEQADSPMARPRGRALARESPESLLPAAWPAQPWASSQGLWAGAGASGQADLSSRWQFRESGPHLHPKVSSSAQQAT